MSDKIIGLLLSIVFISFGIPIRLWVEKVIKRSGGLSKMTEEKSYIFRQLKYGSNLFIIGGILLLWMCFYS